jgi:hypothetical protein
MKRDEMGHRCCGKHKVKRGLWSPEEDEKLLRYITTHGHPSWSSVPKLAGFVSSISTSLFFLLFFVHESKHTTCEKIIVFQFKTN